LLRLNTVASQLRVLGDDISDKELIKKMIHVVPEKLEQVTISMETLLDLDSQDQGSRRHLRAVEQRKKPTPAKETGAPHGGGVDGLHEDQGWVRIQLRDSSWWRER
jgi:hypothetical protein